MSLFTVFASSKVAASVLAAGTLAVGGTGAAAFAGALPTDVQQSAHELLGAPAPHVGGVSETATSGATAEATASATPSATASSTASAKTSTDADSEKATAAVGPDATGPAAFGLCTAFTHGGLDASSTAFKSLAVAAKGEANIQGYCADVTAPGKSASHKAEVSGSSDTAAKVEVPAAPAAPELPKQATVPAAPALPTQVPTERPTQAGRP